MKNKLRKIVIDDEVYHYLIKRDLGHYCIQIRLFLDGFKSTPLIIKFYSECDVIMGLVLYSGKLLPNHLTNTNQIVNLNEPKYIRQFILLGKQNGWTGENKMPVQDGAVYLNTLGFDVSFMNAVSK